MSTHETAAKERAERFVGRTELRQQIYRHCTSENVEDNTMVVNGWMGNGKTSLMAYVATKCIKNLRSSGNQVVNHAFGRHSGFGSFLHFLRIFFRCMGSFGIFIDLGFRFLERCVGFFRNDVSPHGHFVFIHIVDSCSGSSSLLNMLQRLHQELGKYIGKENSLETITDLKTIHSARLEEAAMNDPNKKFIIIVDAVNQFSTGMQAHSMWWLPSRKAPKNLRVIISTLWDTGDTYENALKRCPKAVTVEVPRMLKEDCKEMVIAMLKRHDLEITTENNDDSRVGNQMEKLLNKNQSPLYLKAAVEGMRTKWIMADEVPLSEAHTIYIENLPLTTEELFEKLLDSWAGDFGWELIRWLMTIIALSRDGVKESLLTDLLAHVEEKYQNIAFKNSVKTVLDYIRGFLSSESHDNIRFFHEVLNQVVLEKYGKRNYEPEVRDLLVQFFLTHIKQQISEKSEQNIPYHKDCLSEVVYHQTAIRMFAQDWNRTIPQVSTYEDTLKNIMYIKERIVLNQEMELLNDFRETAQINMAEDERASLSEWERFTQFYWQYIKDFPQWSHAFALNTPRSNAVAKDTKVFLTTGVSVADERFPLKWLNQPDEVDQIGKTLRCVRELCLSCCASTTNQNLVAFGCNGKAFICNQTTGDIVHQVKVFGSGLTVNFSPNGETLWVGNNHGEIKVWDTRLGEEEHEVLKISKNCVVMIKHINDTTVVCGTGGGKYNFYDNTIGSITIIDTTKHSITRRWLTGLPCRSYCYHAGEELVVSGHDEKIICWNVKDGSEGKHFKVTDSRFKLPVFDMCADKYRPVIVFVIATDIAGGEIKTLDIITGECNTIVAVSGRWIAQFDHTGDRIICTSVNLKTIQIHDLSGVLLNTIRIHGGCILNISSLPHPSSFVSAGFDGGKLHIASATPVVENTTQVVTWCELLPNRKEFVTLSEDGEVSVYDASSLQLRGRIVLKFRSTGRRAAVHPSCEYMLVCTWKEVCVVDLYNVEIVHIYRPPDQRGYIKCVQFTPSGDQFMVLTREHGTHVYKVHSMYMFEHLLTFTEMKDGMAWCDVTERQCVNGGDSGIVLWDIDTGKTSQVLREPQYPEREYRYVKFVNSQPRRILYHIWESERDGKKDMICIMDFDGRDMMEFDTKVNYELPKLHIFDNYMITAESDGSLRLHNIHTREILYVFVDEYSLDFSAFMDNPVRGTITCYNGNGERYVFERTFV